MIIDDSDIVLFLAQCFIAIVVFIVVQSLVLNLCGYIFKVSAVKFISSLYVIILGHVLSFVINFIFSNIIELVYNYYDYNGLIFMLLLSITTSFVINSLLVSYFFQVTKWKATGIMSLYFILYFIVLYIISYPVVPSEEFFYFLYYYRSYSMLIVIYSMI